jgi:hypothetical protein
MVDDPDRFPHRARASLSAAAGIRHSCETCEPAIYVPCARSIGSSSRNDVPLSDPLQEIWDLQDLDGADRIEVAGRLRERLLESR